MSNIKKDVNALVQDTIMLPKATLAKLQDAGKVKIADVTAMLQVYDLLHKCSVPSLSESEIEIIWEALRQGVIRHLHLYEMVLPSNN